METLISSPQELTSSWANLGSPLDMISFSRLGLFFTLDVNDSQNVRVRALGMRTSTDQTGFSFPLTTPSTTSVGLEPEYYEITTDADGSFVLEVGTNFLVPYVQIQVMAGTVGATAGEITQADASFSNAPK